LPLFEELLLFNIGVLVFAEFEFMDALEFAFKCSATALLDFLGTATASVTALLDFLGTATPKSAADADMGLYFMQTINYGVL